MLKGLHNASTFLTVAQLRSFAAAAAKLGLSTSATSKAVQRLESDLGVKLLQRTTRTVSLTPEGERYLAGIEQIFTEYDVLTKEVTASIGVPQGILRVSVPPLYGRERLMPLVAGFMLQFPLIQLQISFSSDPIDLAADGFDVAIRAGSLPDSANLVARKIDQVALVTCAVPGLWQRYTKPSEPQQLQNIPAIALDNQIQGRKLRWFYLKYNQRYSVSPRVQLQLDDAHAARQAVLDGIGCANLYDFMLAGQLNAGELETLFQEQQLPATSIYAVYLQRRLLSPRIRVFIDYLLQYLSSL